jgi:predicted O-methyltransferase YrrM
MLRVLEIGTGSGHATLALAAALPADGLLITMEADAGKAQLARRRFAEAGYADRINVIVGEPARFLHKLRGPFDVIYLNVAAASAPPRDRVLALLSPGGALIARPAGKNDTIVVNDMTIAEWLAHAKADAEKRGLPELIPMLEGLAQATERLRAADWNDDADKDTPHDDHQ